MWGCLHLANLTASLQKYCWSITKTEEKTMPHVPWAVPAIAVLRRNPTHVTKWSPGSMARWYICSFLVLSQK